VLTVTSPAVHCPRTVQLQEDQEQGLRALDDQHGLAQPGTPLRYRAQNLRELPQALRVGVRNQGLILLSLLIFLTPCGVGSRLVSKLVFVQFSCSVSDLFPIR
jgi:hypothetical protein